MKCIGYILDLWGHKIKFRTTTAGCEGKYITALKLN